nr:MFS transporter [Ruegeria atlantica]
MHAMNVFVSTTILPSVVKDIGGLSYYAWSTTLFVVFSIVSAALTSRLKNALGPREAYLTALAIFAVGTILCGSATNIAILNAGRAVQGAGGGILYALAYTVIRMVFPEKLWPIAIGLITLMWGVATLLGPAVGGVFAEIGQWRMAFYALLPVSAFIALLSIISLPATRNHLVKAEPIPGIQLLVLVAIVGILSIASSDPTIKSVVYGLLICFALGYIAIRVEKNARGRILPRGALNFLSPFGALYACVAFLLIGMQPETFVPFFLQKLHGQSPLIAGYIGALMALGWTLAASISAGYTEERANRTILHGSVISLGGLIIQVVFLPYTVSSLAILSAICVGLTMVGFGIGYCWPHVTTKIYHAAPSDESDLAAGAITTVQLFATALGAALAGMVVNLAGLAEPGGIEGASSAAFWMCLVFLAAPMLSIFFAIRANKGVQIKQEKAI